MPRLYFDVTRSGDFVLEIIVGNLCFDVESRNHQLIHSNPNTELAALYPGYFRARLSSKRNHITIRLGD